MIDHGVRQGSGMVHPVDALYERGPLMKIVLHPNPAAFSGDLDYSNV
jgi:hypothetical protein